MGETDKDTHSIYTSLAVTAYLSENFEDAIKYNKKAMEYSTEKVKNMVNHCNLGTLYRKMGQYDESLKYLSEAIKINPNNTACIGSYCVLLYHLKRFDEAIIYLKKCVENKDDDGDSELLPECLYIYAQILFDRNEFEKSNAKCIESISCDNFSGYKDKNKIYHLMSNNYSKLSQHDEAKRYVLKANNCNH